MFNNEDDAIFALVSMAYNNKIKDINNSNSLYTIILQNNKYKISEIKKDNKQKGKTYYYRVGNQLIAFVYNNKDYYYIPYNIESIMNNAQKAYIKEPKLTSDKGIKFIAERELSEGTIKAQNLGEYDALNNLIGIYPHYVFKVDEINSTNNTIVYVSDEGITLGYGHWISEKLYNDDYFEKNLIDTYAPNSLFIPTYIPKKGQTYKVPNSKFVPLSICEDLLKLYIRKCEISLTIFLTQNQIELTQNQYDSLISFSYNYGHNCWYTLTELPNFLINNKDNYKPEEVRKIFAIYVNEKRREIEAELFINGYQ